MPTTTSSAVSAYVPAIFGLVGVVAGGLVTTVGQWWLASRQESKNKYYLAVMVIGRLDSYVMACADVVGDDGLSRGPSQYGEVLSPLVTLPTFTLTDLNVDWRSIPADMLYELQEIASYESIAKQIVNSAWEISTPPDNDELFEERQYQFALLGLKAHEAAQKLRCLAKLPNRMSMSWNPIERMKQRKEQIESRRAALMSTYNSMMPAVVNEGAQI